jgi:anthranilate synthase component I
MKTNISLDKVKEIAELKIYKKVAVSSEILADVRTPIELLRILKAVSKHTYILESAEENLTWGRYTFLGFEPKLEISLNNHKIKIKDKDGIKLEEKCMDPAKYIREILKEYKSPKQEELPSFTGGLVGYFSYDYIKYAEPKLKLEHSQGTDFKDMDMMLFDKIIAYDNYKQKIIVIVNMDISNENIEENYKTALEEIKRIIELIKSGKVKEEEKIKLLSDFEPLFNKEEYMQIVEKTKKYIYEGDIFQAVLSNKLEAKASGSLLDVYRRLRISNASPYMFYFSSDDIEIAGASPETLVKLEDKELSTFPLAGTRKRGMTEEEDKKLIKDLLSDEKEKAEHNMLVDLGRNDLGKISKFGSVKVDKYMEIVKFSHVMHIGSTVKSVIREDKDALDAIEAVLPAGTLSGAPKIRACEIIDELEKDKRGIYGGAIGYIDFSGNMDTCISIRLAYKKSDRLVIRSGAGIVADSDPELEYEECVNKMKAVKYAIESACKEDM